MDQTGIARVFWQARGQLCLEAGQPLHDQEQQGGWCAVNARCLFSPLSTEQVCVQLLRAPELEMEGKEGICVGIAVGHSAHEKTALVAWSV